MASNKISFFVVLCLCVLSNAEFGEAQSHTGRPCPDPHGADKKRDCDIYCIQIGFLGGYCQGYTGHYMCECYVG
ncbi:defensin-like protein 34 [Eutrema salsugineum]|uniref:defensin-like protein 34 n=1 Tax=Eutrema salsugineum TaxID=72664 RepID=UPI000CED7309|nr:defensin-like protein 34 [Eutrema salsugineum]